MDTVEMVEMHERDDGADFARNGAMQLFPERGQRLVDLELERIRPCSLNPRSHFDAGAMVALQESMAVSGLIEPIVVREIGGGGYEIIAGERRYRAALALGWARIPAVLRACDEREALELTLIENLIREDIDPIDEARGYQQLRDMGYTNEGIAEKVRRSAPAISNALRLLGLPASVQRLIQEGKLSASHGKEILRWDRYPRIMEVIGRRAAEEGTPTRVLAAGLPFVLELTDAGLRRAIPEVALPFDIAVCRRCPFAAFVEQEGSGIHSCLRPEHYDELAARAYRTGIGDRVSGVGNSALEVGAGSRGDAETRSGKLPTPDTRSPTPLPGVLPIGPTAAEIDAAIRKSLGGHQAWERAKRAGLSNVEIRARIADLWIGEGVNQAVGVRYCYDGARLALWVGTIMRRGEPTLEGSALVAAVRRVFEIPEVEGVEDAGVVGTLRDEDADETPDEAVKPDGTHGTHGTDGTPASEWVVPLVADAVLSASLLRSVEASRIHEGNVGAPVLIDGLLWVGGDRAADLVTVWRVWELKDYNRARGANRVTGPPITIQEWRRETWEKRRDANDWSRVMVAAPHEPGGIMPIYVLTNETRRYRVLLPDSEGNAPATPVVQRPNTSGLVRPLTPTPNASTASAPPVVDRRAASAPAVPESGGESSGSGADAAVSTGASPTGLSGFVTALVPRDEADWMTSQGLTVATALAELRELRQASSAPVTHGISLALDAEALLTALVSRRDGQTVGNYLNDMIRMRAEQAGLTWNGTEVVKG